jgi:hypothetical protein
MSNGVFMERGGAAREKICPGAEFFGAPESTALPLFTNILIANILID